MVKLTSYDLLIDILNKKKTKQSLVIANAFRGHHKQACIANYIISIIVPWSLFDHGRPILLSQTLSTLLAKGARGVLLFPLK